MFKIKSKVNGYEYTVYSIRHGDNGIEFLIYAFDGWFWTDASRYRPVK